MYGGPDPDNRHDMPVWGFDPVGRTVRHPGEALPNPAAVFARLQLLIGLRTTLPALAEGSYDELWRQNGPANSNAFAYGRRSGDSQVIVLINNGANSANINLQAPAWLAPDARLVEQLKDSSNVLELNAGRIKLTLPARTSAFYVRAP